MKGNELKLIQVELLSFFIFKSVPQKIIKTFRYFSSRLKFYKRPSVMWFHIFI